MPVLKNLDNAPLDEMDAVIIKDSSALETILDYNSRFACTTAGPHGCINIWLDLDGKYRAEVQRSFSVIDELKTESLSELEKFTDRWIEKINN